MDAPEDKPNWIGRAASVLQHVPGASLLFAIVPLFVLGYLGWFYYGAEHLDKALYSLKQENLTVTQQPDWIQSNVVEDVFRNANLNNISLLSQNANAIVAQAFETNHWIKSTNRVTKATGGKVVVDVTYRRPVAMVWYEPDPNMPAVDGVQRKPGFFPVDDDGVVLPTTDFQNLDGNEISNYFVLWAAGARPAGDAGMAFGDVRITEALQLCKFLYDDRQALGIKGISITQENRSSSSSPWIMVLHTIDDLSIIWGHAPSVQAPSEPSPKNKRDFLFAWLENARKTNSRASVDLRKSTAGQPVSVKQ